jgi:hypothetical protein
MSEITRNSNYGDAHKEQELGKVSSAVAKGYSVTVYTRKSGRTSRSRARQGHEISVVQIRASSG